MTIDKMEAYVMYSVVHGCKMLCSACVSLVGSTYQKVFNYFRKSYQNTYILSRLVLLCENGENLFYFFKFDD